MPWSTVLGLYSLHQTTQRAAGDKQKPESISKFCRDTVAYPAEAETKLWEENEAARKVQVGYETTHHIREKICPFLPIFLSSKPQCTSFTILCNLLSTGSARSPFIPQRTPTMVLSENTLKALKSACGRKETGITFSSCLKINISFKFSEYWGKNPYRKSFR